MEGDTLSFIPRQSLSQRRYAWRHNQIHMDMSIHTVSLGFVITTLWPDILLCSTKSKLVVIELMVPWKNSVKEAKEQLLLTESTFNTEQLKVKGDPCRSGLRGIYFSIHGYGHVTKKDAREHHLLQQTMKSMCCRKK
ncbi:hypothetical protein XENOCAPTIV_024770 [Xenoophorus captivus]|uniref:Uncharacterized protein n=1 Tax=Xenoophorus captivus TaxID=1517983 RepID=A0ABV0QXN9_9TELE